MRKGPIIHGILLIGALLFAYQTWTREETVEPITGEIVVWSVPPEQLKGIMFQADGREIHVERRTDDQGPYYWGSDERIIEQYLPPDKNKPDAGPGPRTPEQPVKASTKREFMVGEKGDELFQNLTELRALRTLGKLDDEQKKLYELTEKTQTVSVIHDGGKHSLVLGGKVFGSGDRYALNPDTGEGYVVSQVVTRDLANGEAGLRLAKLHNYDDDEVGKAVIEVKGQKRTMLRTKVTNESGRETRTWADATTPGKPNQTMANFLRNVEMLKPARFVSDVDLSRAERVVRVEYQTAAGEPLGWVELYQQPRPAEQGQAPAAPGTATPAGATPAGATPAGATPGTATPAGATPGTATPAGATPGTAGATPAGAAPGTATPAGATPGTATPAGATPAGQAPAGASGQQGVPEKDEERRAVYIMRTEVTRIPAGVAYTSAARITEDIEQIFGQ
jgi:hypothetical protein